MSESSEPRRTFLGREDVNSVESILADDAVDFGDVFHTQAVGGDAIFTWDYERTRPALSKLYEKAKQRQWNANDLPWETDVDVEAVAVEMSAPVAHFRERMTALEGSPVRLRPHSKTHKCAVIGRMQIARGAVGVSRAGERSPTRLARAGTIMSG